MFGAEKSKAILTLQPVMVLATLLAVTLAPLALNAAESVTPMPPVPKAPRVVQPAPTSADATTAARFPEKVTHDELAFTMLVESYLNREKPPAGVPDYTQIGAHFRNESQGRLFRGTLELGGSFATTVENYSNIYVPEAFLDLRTPSWDESELSGDFRARLSTGRRLEAWSLLDRDWDLGLWEPLNRFDAIHPIDQGLTGFFLEAANGNWRLIGFGTPVFVPEQGGSFTLQNGKFKSSSPWFSEPTDRLILFSESTQVQYDINTPSVGSVINHASGGFLLRYGDMDRGFYSQASYMLKPRNQLSTPFEGSLNLTDTTSYAAVTIEPQVVYHQMAGAEVGYQADRYMVGMSALTDVPINEFPGPNLTYQELEPLVMLSPKVEGRFDLGATSDMTLGVSYLHSIGGGFTMHGPFASDKAVFGSRTPFREAVALDGRMMIGRGRKTSITLGGRWLEELAEQGSLLSADASVDFATNGSSKDWRFSVVGDVLGSRLPPNENQGYVSRYRGNDRWMSKLRFLF